MIDRYGIDLPAHIVHHLRSTEQAPLPADLVFQGNTVHVVASAKVSLEAASAASSKMGIPAVILSDSLEGEAREAGAFHAAIAREIENNARPFQRPVVLLSGGETTVTVKGRGKGGRNTEFLLSLALSISSTKSFYALAADTDGIDGSEDNAGAFVDSESIDRMLDRGVRAEDHLINNDAWTAFEAIGDLFVCGPTGTNVNDFRAILISQ
jgi:hydroxypyruvate reductase